MEPRQKKITAEEFLKIAHCAEDLSHRSLELALENIPIAEFNKITRFLPAQKISLPVLEVESEPFSLIALEFLRIEMEQFLKKLERQNFLHLKNSLDEVIELFAMDLAFVEILGYYLKVSSLKAKFIQRSVRAELMIIFNEALDEINLQIGQARLLHEKKFELYDENLSQLERDLLIRAIASKEWLERILPVVRTIKGTIGGLADSLIPVYSRVELHKHLEPAAQIFSKGYLDIDFRDLASRTWTDVDIALPERFLPRLGGDQSKKTTASSAGIRPFEVLPAKGKLGEVILPEATSQHLRALCRHYKAESSSGRVLRLTLLLKGPPGTGKTMTAMALATELGMPVLRISLPDSLGSIKSQIVGFFAARAEAGNFVLFFDECEDLLSHNPFKGSSDSWAKILFDSFKGVAIFATNYSAPKGFERRMTYVVDYKAPSARVRETILNNEIDKLKNDGFITQPPSNIEIERLAQNFQISGGYYQQILQLALASSPQAELDAKALENAFEHWKSCLGTRGLDEAREPKISLHQVKLDDATSAITQRFVSYARKLLGSNGNSPLLPQGALALFKGPPGTGKTILAEAIARELGIEIRKISPSSILSKYVGESEEKIREVFREATKEKYLLFIDEAEGLMGDRQSARQSWEKTRVDEFLQQVESFKGVLIIATNFPEMLDQAFARRFLFHFDFKVPDVKTRYELWLTWKEILGVDESVLQYLARSFPVSGGEIRNVAIRANAFGESTLESLTKLCEESLGARTGMATRAMGIR